MAAPSPLGSPQRPSRGGLRVRPRVDTGAGHASPGRAIPNPHGASPSSSSRIHSATDSFRSHGSAKVPSGPVRALLVLNVQNDFFEGGSFPITGAERALQVINVLRARQFDVVFVCSTHRPPNFVAFSSNNPGTELHELAVLDDVGPQPMWPDHCVEGTTGANFHPDLVISPSDVLTSTGHDPHSVVHSAFGNAHRTGNTSLLERVLRDRGVTQLFLCGLTTDYGVLYTALDARLLLPDVKVFVVEDACVGVTPHGVADAHRKFTCERVELISSSGEVLDAVEDGTGPGDHTVFGPLPDDVLDKADTRLDFLLAAEAMVTESPSDKTTADALVKALASGLPEAAKHMLGHVNKAVLNTLVQPLGWSPLHVAAATGDVEMVNLLMSKGAKPSLEASADGSTPVLIALRHGFLGVVKTILGAVPSTALISDRTHKMTPLMCACQHADIDAIRFILSVIPEAVRKKHVMRQNRYGMTALMYACASAEAEWVHHASAFRKGRFELLAQQSPLADSDEDDAGDGGSVESGEAQHTTLLAGGGGDIVTKRHAHEGPRLHSATTAVKELLRVFDTPDGCLDLLRTQDKEGWGALHFAARSGLLARIEWDAMGRALSHVPVNQSTRSGLTMLHLCVWNGHASGVAVLLGAWPGRRNPWRSRVQLHKQLKGRRHTELDLAIMRRHVDCARLLIRAKCHSSLFAGPRCELLLHRLLLQGDGIAAELLLRDETNKVHVNKQLLAVTKSMKYPNTCTFTFAGYHNPMKQHMYECRICAQRVCLVCSYKCHDATPWRHSTDHAHELVYVGAMEAYCGCHKDTCKALAGVDQREAEGYKYVPRPVHTTTVVLDEETKAAEMAIAKKIHSASVRLGESLMDPHPTERFIPIAGRSYDLLSLVEVNKLVTHVQANLKALKALGVSVAKRPDRLALGTGDPGLVSPLPGSRRSSGAGFERNPLSAPPSFMTMGSMASFRSDASLSTKLSPPMEQIVTLLAKNMHEEWAQARFNAGWRFAAIVSGHDDTSAHQMSDLLVPFDLLTEEEKMPAKRAARELVRALLSKEFALELTPSSKRMLARRARQLPKGVRQVSPERMRKRMAKLSFIKQGLYNAFLVSAACTGNTDIIPDLLSAGGQGANVNCADERARTPLYLAVQRRQAQAVETLIQFGADLEMADDVGVTPLSVASFLGAVDLVNTLLEHGASYSRRDLVNMTPIHYAAYAGHVHVVTILARRLSLPGRPGVDFRFEPMHDTITVAQQEGWATNVMARIAERRAGSRTPSAKAEPSVISKVSTLLRKGGPSGRGTPVTPIRPEVEVQFGHSDSKTELLPGTRQESKQSASDRRINPDFTVSDLVTDSLHISKLLGGSSRNESAWASPALPQPRVPALASVAEGEAAEPPPFELHPSSVAHAPAHQSRTHHGVQALSARVLHRGMTAVASEMNMARMLSMRRPHAGAAAGKGGGASTGSLPRLTIDEEIEDLMGTSSDEDEEARGGAQDSGDGRGDGDEAKDDDVGGKPVATAAAGSIAGGIAMGWAAGTGAGAGAGAGAADTTAQSRPPRPRTRMTDILNSDRARAPARTSSFGPSFGVSSSRRNMLAQHSRRHITTRDVGGSERGLKRAHSKYKLWRMGGGSSRPVRRVISNDSLQGYGPEESGLKHHQEVLPGHLLHRLVMDNRNNIRVLTDVETRLPEERFLEVVRLSPLTLAVTARHTDIIKLLITFGADATRPDGSGLSPHQRALMDHADAVDALAAAEEEKAIQVEDTQELQHHTQQQSTRLRSFESARSAASPSGKARWATAQAAFHTGQLSKSSRGTAVSRRQAPKLKRRRGAINPQPKGRRGSLQYERFSDKLAAAAERFREETVENARVAEQTTRKVVHQLTDSRQVEKQRDRFAWTTLLGKVVSLLVVIVAFSLITPLSTDYESPVAAEFVQGVLRHGSASFGRVHSPADWWLWFDRNILWLQASIATSAPTDRKAIFTDLLAHPLASFEDSNAGPLTSRPLFYPVFLAPTSAMNPSLTISPWHSVLLGENLVLGAVKVVVGTRTWSTCALSDEVRHGPSMCLGGVSDSDVVFESYLLHSDNATQRRIVSDPFRTGAGAWLQRTAREVRVEAVVYNPHVSIFASVVFKLSLHTTGIVEPSVEVVPAFLFQRRFQPSVLFEVVAGVLFAIQLVAVMLDVRHIGIRRAWHSGWTLFEVLLLLLLGTVLVVDLVNLFKTAELEMDMQSTSKFVDVLGLVEQLRTETDLLAVLLLLVVFRLVKYLRFIPKWGPMMVAVLMTWQDLFVLLYLAVALGLTACFAVSFHIAFGTELPGFATLWSSFSSLFGMGFTGSWSVMQAATPRTITTLFYIFYVMFAIVLLNLFIGIVTDVYPKARKKSQERWEQLITRLMEEHVRWEQATASWPRWQRWVLALSRQADYSGNRTQAQASQLHEHKADKETFRALVAVTSGLTEGAVSSDAPAPAKGAPITPVTAVTTPRAAGVPDTSYSNRTLPGPSAGLAESGRTHGHGHVTSPFLGMSQRSLGASGFLDAGMSSSRLLPGDDVATRLAAQDDALKALTAQLTLMQKAMAKLAASSDRQ